VVNTPIGASFPTLKGLFHPQKTKSSFLTRIVVSLTIIL